MWTLATTISHHPRTRWHYLQAADGCWYLYVDGREWPVSNDLQPLLQQLTAQPTSSRESLQTWLDHPDAATLLLSLVNEGYLLLSHD